MFANLLRCGILQGACTATDDDDDVAVADQKDPTVHTTDLLKKFNQLSNQQIKIRELLADYKKRLAETQLPLEQGSIRHQCSVLLDSYKQNEALMSKIMDARNSIENTQTTLQTAQLMSSTIEAQREMIDATKRAFKGKTSQDIITEQVKAERELEGFNQLTDIVSQSKSQRDAGRLGIAVSMTSVEDEMDAILGLSSPLSEAMSSSVPPPIELPVFPPVETTPPSVSLPPYAHSVRM